MTRFNSALQQSLSLHLNYAVVFTDGVFSDGDDTLAKLIDSSGTPRCVVFVDAGVTEADSGLCDRVAAKLGCRLAMSVQAIRGGEESKHGLLVVERCAQIIDQAGIDRHAYVIAIGGGAMLDVVGFSAAITHRGVRLIRMPTTVLAQNDAGIGVKNGVNFFGKKNFLGSFAPPHAVINDFSLLRTLRSEQWRDGTAEAVKVALIRDAIFFEWIEQHVPCLVERDADAFRYLIHRCAELHLEHITTSGDPFERGSARPLDFGHWAAHKLETLSNFKISHGHAVAIGMAIDATYASKMKLCEPDVGRRILSCLRALRFTLDVGQSMAIEVEALLSGISEFREHLGGALSLSMVPVIGKAIEIHSVNFQVLGESIQEILFP